MRNGIKAALAGAALLTAGSAQAEVIQTSDEGFITRDVVVVETNLTQTWLALISPAQWWSSQHTWSADAANLRLTPQAGGCFCEKIPEVDEPGRFTLEGSVEHMRVIQAYPNSALRMIGALGPLQSEPVTGVLTIALSEVDLPGTPDLKGTRIVWEYNVGGSMRYEIPVISKSVDGVMSLQLAGLADKLGKVEMAQEDAADAPSKGASGPVSGPVSGAVSGPASGAASGAASEEASGGVGAGAIGAIEPEDTLKEGVEEGKPAVKKGPSVDEAFDNFGDFPDDDAIINPAPEEDPEEGPPIRVNRV